MSSAAVSSAVGRSASAAVDLARGAAYSVASPVIVGVQVRAARGTRGTGVRRAASPAPQHRQRHGQPVGCLPRPAGVCSVGVQDVKIVPWSDIQLDNLLSSIPR